MLQSEQTRTQIAKLAYLHWEKRGRPSDSPEVDWYQAVEELKHQRELHAPLFESFMWLNTF